MTYKEKLLDPRWQKKRLEILERDEFTCQKCSDNKSTLHVHHKKYGRGNEPWDAPSEYLVTLCKSCHDEESETQAEYCQLLQDAVKEKFLADDIFCIASGFAKMPIKHLQKVQASALEWFLSRETNIELMLKMYFEHLRQRRGGVQNG